MEQIRKVERLIERSGMPISFLPSNVVKDSVIPKQQSNQNFTDETLENRVRFAKNRQEWEESFQRQTMTTKTQSKTLLANAAKQKPVQKSTVNVFGDTTPTLEQQSNGDAEWDMMLALLQRYYRDHGNSNVPLHYGSQPKLAKWVEAQKQAYRGMSKPSLTQKQVDALNALHFPWTDGDTINNTSIKNDEHIRLSFAAAKTSELVAKAGGGDAFTGQSLGIGGLDDVLLQVKRRIWVPLAAPPSLLHELGINPVRGLLLYGMPGCGKTLLAKKLGQILSPARPITIVSGPELLDKYVGSSEANLREIFDNPPDIYPYVKEALSKDDAEAISKVALHVIVMDEFDAMARQRGGRGGKGDQGDAGVARDSVVNQLLAKMDGVDELAVPTLVIGLTNRRSLIEPALLRPGRFEVQIEVPPPKSVAQRASILNVHMSRMYKAGRMLVADAPQGTPASEHLQVERASP